MVDLEGGVPTDGTDPNDATADVVDMEFIQDQADGDDSFVEELQEKLRPLYVS